jgi:hypothetical protein
VQKKQTNELLFPQTDGVILVFSRTFSWRDVSRASEMDSLLEDWFDKWLEL